MVDKTIFGNYADENTSFSSKEDIDQVIRNTEEFCIPLLKCFKNSKIKINPFKYHLLLSGNKRC